MTLKLKELLYIGFIFFVTSCVKTPGDFISDNPLDSGGTNWNPPIVIAQNDTSININDSLLITAISTDNGIISKYIWSRDDGSYLDTTIIGSLKVAYADSGKHVVFIRAIDDEGVISTVDTCIVNVTLDAPIVTAQNDTVVSYTQTSSVSVSATAMDVNAGGSIKKYYWDISANGWDDSTDVGNYTVTTSVGGLVTVICGARDDDGVMSTDTFTVLFNRAPTSATLTALNFDTSWVLFDLSKGKGTLPLSFSAIDPDGLYDTLTYTLSTGVNSYSLTQIYSGKSIT